MKPQHRVPLVTSKEIKLKVMLTEAINWHTHSNQCRFKQRHWHQFKRKIQLWHLIAIQTAHLLITLANACHYLNATWCSEVNKCWCYWCSHTDTIFTQSDNNVPSDTQCLACMKLLSSWFINEQILLPGPKLFVFVGIYYKNNIYRTQIFSASGNLSELLDISHF